MSSLPSSQNVPTETPDTSPGPDTVSPIVADQTQQEATAENQEEEEAMDEDENVMSLPLSKIKRIFKMDPDFSGASAGAVYATGVATELFVQYLVEHASMLAKMDKRKKLQYKDFSGAVSTQNALYFLNDTIPKTQPVGQAIKNGQINMSVEDTQKYAEVIGEKEEEPHAAPSRPATVPILPKGQSSLPFAPAPKTTVRKAVLHDLMSNDDDQDGAAMVID